MSNPALFSSKYIPTSREVLSVILFPPFTRVVLVNNFLLVHCHSIFTLFYCSFDSTSLTMSTLYGISLNANRLKSPAKRRAIFSMRRNGNFDFAFLQESHFTSDIEPMWQAEWGGSIYCSNGRSNGRGVMTLFPRNSNIKVGQQVRDQRG